MLHPRPTFFFLILKQGHCTTHVLSFNLSGPLKPFSKSEFTTFLIRSQQSCNTYVSLWSGITVSTGQLFILLLKVKQKLLDPFVSTVLPNGTVIYLWVVVQTSWKTLKGQMINKLASPPVCQNTWLCCLGKKQPKALCKQLYSCFCKTAYKSKPFPV